MWIDKIKFRKKNVFQNCDRKDEEIHRSVEYLIPWVKFKMITGCSAL